MIPAGWHSMMWRRTARRRRPRWPSRQSPN